MSEPRTVQIEIEVELEKLNPMPHDEQSWINTLWLALDYARELYTDDQWDEICMAMAWNTEELGCEDPIKLGLM